MLAAAVPERQVELLSGSPIFAPLDPATLEALALRLEPRRVDTGEVVFAQGEAGDEYYLVDSGRLNVAVDGETISELDEGDGFGEIALLRDVPRTATVTALEESSLYALERDDFLGAVSGHAHSRAAAESLVTSRLSPAVL